MSRIVIFILLLLNINEYTRQTPLPHGMVFGKRPDTTGMVKAANALAFMGKKIRISTTIIGKVAKVTREKGGWFELGAPRQGYIGTF